MKKISKVAIAAVVVLACVVLSSCANVYTLGLSEVGFDQISNNAYGNYTLKTVTVTYNSSGAKVGEASTDDGIRSSLQVKTEILGIKVLTGAKSYANANYSKIVLYKCTTNSSGVKISESWLQYTR